LFLESLSLTNFRNYSRVDISFSHGTNLVLGKNGAGKSNLLEAVYILSTSKSFRNITDSKLKRWGTDSYEVRGVFSSENGEYEIELSYTGDKKRLLINGSPEERISNIIGLVYCVIFFFDDILLVMGPPKVRRSFLDLILSTIDPLYFAYLKNYMSVFKQKAKYLRDSTLIDRNLLLSWNEKLVDSGVYILQKRYSLVRFINNFIEHSVRGVFNSRYPYKLVYRTNVPGADSDCLLDSIQSSFSKELEKMVDKEIRVSQCIIGPHRDDLIFSDEKLEVRSFGSIGEARLSSIILKCAQSAFYQNKGITPILLMDDILLELDRKNMEKVLTIISDKSQKIVTTTEIGKLPEIFSYDEVFYIEEKGKCICKGIEEHI
jgi:DNA replication and repair protein RecF